MKYPPGLPRSWKLTSASNIASLGTLLQKADCPWNIRITTYRSDDDNNPILAWRTTCMNGDWLPGPHTTTTFMMWYNNSWRLSTTSSVPQRRTVAATYDQMSYQGRSQSIQSEKPARTKSLITASKRAAGVEKLISDNDKLYYSVD